MPAQPPCDAPASGPPGPSLRRAGSPDSATRRRIRLPAPTHPEHRVWRKAPLRPAARLARLAIGAHIVMLVAALVVLLVAALTQTGLGQGPDPSTGRASVGTRSPAEHWGEAELVAHLLVAASGLAAVAAFANWLYRATLNWATEGRPRHDARWALVTWLVPVLNLWRPPMMVADLCADRPGMRRLPNGEGRLIVLWWLSGLVGSMSWVAVMGRALGLGPDGEPPGRALAVALGLLLVSASAALALVGDLTARHDRRPPGPP